MADKEKGDPIVTLDFRGVVDPAEVVDVGRDDIVGEARPGSRMIAAVRQHDFTDGHVRATQVQGTKSAPEPERRRDVDLRRDPEAEWEMVQEQEEPSVSKD